MQLKNGHTILFLCDRKACGEVCPSPTCTHTGDIRHAKNFDQIDVTARHVDFFELEQPAVVMR